MPANPISMCDAIKEINFFKEKHGAIPTRACAISLADLFAIFEFASRKNIPVVGIRCYYAKKSKDDEPVRLLVVGTTQNFDGVVEDIYDPSTGDGVFDLTTPCPEFCDLNSPLMTLQFPGCH